MKLVELCESLSGQLEVNPACSMDSTALNNLEINQVLPLDKAQINSISFFSNSKYGNQLKKTQAAAVLVSNNDPVKLSETSVSFIRVHNAYFSFAKALKSFNPDPLVVPGIHSTAVIEKSASIGKEVSIGSHCYIGPENQIGDNTEIRANVVIERNCTIGKHCKIHANVTIRENCVLKDRVILQPGAVIGGDGFGYVRDEKGMYHNVPQTGNVVLEDDVEVGANTTIDRAVLGSTLIRRGTKLDNLVMIAHNVEIGENTAIAGQAGISGSTKVGNQVLLGGQAGLAGHLKIGNNAIATAQAGVSRDIPDGEMWSDTPARPLKTMRRIQATLMKLPELAKRLKKLEERESQ